MYGERESRSIRASVLHGPKDLRIEHRHLPPPEPDEVQVAISSTGVCGSDVHYYQHYRNGDIFVREPLSLGHESIGVIVALGSDVSLLQVGDKVALEVGIPCGTCQRCMEGRYNICPKLGFRSSAKSFPHLQGTMQDAINHPASWCHPLPPHMSPELGALIEPLSVAVHAVRRANPAPRAKVLVIGAGAIGLLVAAVCKDRDATVLITDVDASRLSFAVHHGFADYSFTMSNERPLSAEKSLIMAQEAAVSFSGVRTVSGDCFGLVDAAFECTGVPLCTQSAIHATRGGGNVTMIGMGNAAYMLPISAAALREVDLLGSFRYANAYPSAIELLSKTSENSPAFEKLVTHRFEGLGAVPAALEMACRKLDDDGNAVIKVILTNN